MNRRLLPSLLLVLLVFGSAWAEETKPADFLKSLDGWKIAFPKEMKADVVIVADAQEGKPALKVEVPEGDVESWKGKISHPVVLPAPGNYTVSFYAKAEPSDAYLELSVWGSLPDQPKNLGPRVNFKVMPEWQEFVYDFSVSAADPAANVTWGNLARGGKTFFIGDIRVTKDK